MSNFKEYRALLIVVDPDPGFAAFLPLDPGQVFSGSRRISDPESRVPDLQPIFLRA